MNCFFCKTTPYRNRYFQITTKMYLLDNGKKVVEKINTYTEGKNNISRIAMLSGKINDVFGENYSTMEYNNGGLLFEYVENSVSLDALLRTAIDNKAWDRVEALLDKWCDIIVGENNIVSFDNSSEFIRYFGEYGTSIVGDKATKMSNLDCSADNILFVNGENSYKVIDCEWVFDFSIPVDYIRYYTLRLFCKKHYDKSMLSKMCSMLGIEEKKCAVYDDMTAHFYDYISIDENGIDYRTLGNKFLKAIYRENVAETEYQYSFPVDRIPRNCRVAVYGAGDVGRDYVDYINGCKEYTLAGWLDRNYEMLSSSSQVVISPQKITEIDFDYVLLAVCNRAVAVEMKKTLLNMGVSGDKIYWDEKNLI